MALKLQHRTLNRAVVKDNPQNALVFNDATSAGNILVWQISNAMPLLRRYTQYKNT